MKIKIKGSHAKLHFEDGEKALDAYFKLNYTRFLLTFLVLSFDCDYPNLPADGNLYVTNLPVKSDPNLIFKAFYNCISKYGDIISIHIYTNDGSGLSTGKAVV